MQKLKKRNKGITLIALVVTIVVLLILAGISIGVLTGDNGIINQAKKGKEETEIGEEKEMIDISVAQAIENDVYGNLKIDSLQEKLDNNTGEGTTNTIDSGDTIVVKFIEKNRYYEVDKDGNVDGPKEMIEDENAGDISKGGEQDGSIDKPFKINCIEDLVVFSMMTNGGNSELDIEHDNFMNKYVELTKTLDFKSIFSYCDYTTKKYGDLNEDGIVEDIKTELTKTEKGCIGFTPIGCRTNKGNFNFCGIFDGKNYEIRNIYQLFQDSTYNRSIGLFGLAQSGEIKNLTVTGNIINKKWHAAGIMAEGNSKITNCKNYTNVTGYNMVGGIAAFPQQGDVQNCINYGNIVLTGKAYLYGGVGGIAGSTAKINITNCTNIGKIEEQINSGNIGGIIGYATNIVIDSCLNNGISKNGIIGWITNGNNKILNCYNLAKCDNGIINSYRGASWENELILDISNCYNLGEVTNSGIIGHQGTVCKSITLNIENCYSAGICKYAILGKLETISETTTNIKNTYYDNTKISNIGAITEGIEGISIKNNQSFVETLNNNIGENKEWLHWKMGEDGYPTFE